MAQTHPVVSGDTASAIAKKYGTTVGKLQAANPQYSQFVSNAGYIQAGWTLNLPGTTPTAPTTGTYINKQTQQSYPIGTASPGYNAQGQPISTAPTVAPTPELAPLGSAERTQQIIKSGRAALEKSYEFVPLKDEQARIDAVNEANQNAQDIFDNLPGDEVDMRESTKILEDIQAKMAETAGKIPAPTSMVDLFKEQKEKLGISPLEDELAGIDSDIERIQTELLVQAEEEGEKLVSTREIGRAKGVLQKRAEREIALLNVERSAVARILGNKVDTLNAIVKLTDMDYDNASDYYTKEYNREVQLYNLISGAEERELTHIERAKDDARSSLVLIHNLLKDGNLTYDVLNTDQKLKIAQYEAMLEFPSGITAQIMTDEPDKKIQTVTSRTDESGNTYYDVLLTDKDGAMTVNSIFRGVTAPTGKGGEVASVEEALLASKKGGEYVDGNVYLDQRRKSTLSPDEFDKRFGDLLSPDDRTKYGITKKGEEGFGTASEQSKAMQWLSKQPGVTDEDYDKLKTDRDYFYWALGQAGEF